MNGDFYDKVLPKRKRKRELGLPVLIAAAFICIVIAFIVAMILCPILKMNHYTLG